jgi:plasmid replication initiation protein
MPDNLFNSNTYVGINTTINFNTTATVVTNSSINSAKATGEITENPSKIYGEKWIVMQNRLVHAISNLELDERRLVLHLSPIVRKMIDIDPTTKRFSINANDFAKEFDLKGNHYYELVRQAANSLQDKSFYLWEFDKNDKVQYEARVSWVGKSLYKPRSSIIEVSLMDDVIEMLSVFDRHNPFTKYHKDLIMHLSSDGMILLELVASFESKRSRQESYTTEFIREKFNRVDIYASISEFKRNVLDKAVAELKKYTPYTVKYKTEANSGGRTITHFVFSVDKELSLIDGDVTTLIAETPKKTYKKGLTEKQIAKLSKNKELFVDANQHLVTDKSLDYYQIFESFKPLLEDTATVNDFDGLSVFLAANKGDVIPAIPKQPANPNKAAAKKPSAPKSKKPAVFEASKTNIKALAANPDFQRDYPMSGAVIGSEKHRQYLEFRLESNITEFGKKPLSSYSK